MARNENKNKEEYLASVLLETLEEEDLVACKQILISLHANPNIITDRGFAPIHYASGMENVKLAEEIMRLMLELGGDPNVRSDDKLTPLHVAAMWGRENIVKMLLENGGDINSLDEDNKTPIAYAIHECHYGVVQVIKNFMFDKKIIKDFSLIDKECTSMVENSLNMNNQDAIKNLNFDTASPFYSNITHRRKYNQKHLDVNGTGNADGLHSHHDFSTLPINLFELTEKNLTKYAEYMSSERSMYSFINKWREKVIKSKSKKSFINKFTDIDSLLSGIIDDNTINFTNTELQVDNEKDAIINKSTFTFNLTKFGKLINQLKSVESKTDHDEKSFHTAISNKLSLHSPQHRNDYVIQTAEEYIHTDEESGLVFYEKCSKITNIRSKQSHDNNSTNSTISLNYDSETLRKELTNFCDCPGPITKTTKKLYIKRLMNYKRNPVKIDLLQRNTIKSIRQIFSIELEQTIRNMERFERIHEFMNLEKEISDNFRNRSKDMKQSREGNLKNNFIYLLMDSRISDNLPAQSVYMKEHDVWRTFLNSIFYVGKGKSIRPYQHLYDAMKIFSKFYEKHSKETIEKVTIYGGQKVPKTIPLDKLDEKTIKDITKNKKLERILEIWKSGKGVICLHVFHNILSTEAYTREAAIIEAIGLKHLTNMKRGEYYGISKTWPTRKRRNLGIALLYKSLQIFLVEGESQLLPCDLV